MKLKQQTSKPKGKAKKGPILIWETRALEKKSHKLNLYYEISGEQWRTYNSLTNSLTLLKP